MNIPSSDYRHNIHIIPRETSVKIKNNLNQNTRKRIMLSDMVLPVLRHLL